MKKLGREHVIYAHSRTDRPVMQADPGELFSVETYDCYQGQMLPENARYENCDRSRINPATGPVYITGAMPGDTLRIEIIRIETGPVGIVDCGTPGSVLEDQYSCVTVKRLPVEEQTLIYEGRRVPIDPMIGIIGVAPAGTPVSTLSPGAHGGNLDCRKIKEGAVLYLPVATEGALLSIGDLHAVMGDGEVGNCGVEIEGSVTVRTEVIPGTGRDYIMLENQTEWISIASAESLDLAAEMATRQMNDFLRKEKGMSPVDAGILLTLAGNLAVCQVVNPLKTVRLELSKAWIGSWMS
ncbi:MAG: acetamidase/formamidase family protein [Lachnospiraceae bacterium]